MIDGKEILATARAEIARRKDCPQHRFTAQTTYRLGEKLTCNSCGASMRLSEIGLYARGYAAAGGNPDDILPGIVKESK